MLVGGLTALPAGSAPATLDSRALATVLTIERAAERHPGAESLADLGAIQAFLGRSREAQVTLRQAAELSPHDARILSDLGAAYLTEAGGLAGPERLAALDAVDRALDLAPDLVPARANLVMALAANFFPSRSEDPVRSPARADPTLMSWPLARARLEASPWPGTAAAGIISRFPRDARKFAEERLLERWAEEVRKGEASAAAQTLALIAEIGRAAIACCAESMLAQAAAELRRVDPAVARRLARGVLQAAAGIKSCQANEGVSGMALLAAAERDFAGDLQPLRSWAQYGRGLCAYQSARFDQAIALLNALEQDLGERYPALRMRLLWVRGGSLGRSGRHAESLRDYHAAHELAERAGATAERAGVDLNLYEKLWLLGQRHAAWPWLFEGCQLAVAADDPRRLNVAFTELYQAAHEAGYTRAALHFADRLVTLSPPELGQAGLANALYRRACAQAALGRRGAALGDLLAAEHAVAALLDQRSREQWQSDIWGERGRILLETDPAAATAELVGAVSAAQELRDAARTVRFLVELSRAQADMLAAAASLRRAVAELERQRSNLEPGEDRADFLVQARVVYDQWMTTALSAHQAPQAIFHIADQARARALRDALGRPQVGAEITRGLGPGRALVEFAVLPHNLLTWVFHDGRLSFHAQSVEAGDLEAWVGSLTGRGGNNGGALGQRRADALHRLSRVLTEPISGEIASAATLLFCPDKSLRRIPFAMLLGATGRPLIEDHALVVVPSAALADLASADTWSPPHSAFVLGDPRLDARTFAFLPALPGAADEARQVASLYGHGSDLQLGESATASALVQGFGHRTVVHLAAHILANDDRPEMAALPLAQTRAADPAALTAADIRHLGAGSTRIVVLSACRAAGSQDDEGSRGLVEAFLAAGVPRVVAALWDVDDRPAQVFFVNFHRHLQGGDKPPEALRAAQLALSHARDPNLSAPAAWAGYELFQVAPGERRQWR
jgi:hypothetical protein